MEAIVDEVPFKPEENAGAARVAFEQVALNTQGSF